MLHVHCLPLFWLTVTIGIEVVSSSLEFDCLLLFHSNYSDFVNSLMVFDISCSVLSANTVLQCTTASTTLPGRTICQVDNLDPFPCETLHSHTKFI